MKTLRPWITVLLCAIAFCSPAFAKPRLTVVLDPPGVGSVVSSPAGIDCPAGACSALFDASVQFPIPTFIRLTATPPEGGTVSWTGGIATGKPNVVDVFLFGDTTVTAHFGGAQPTHALSVTKGGTGGGSVISTTGSIDCGGTCTAAFSSGSTVTLVAIAETGSTFAGWSGACSGTGNCTVTMDAAKQVVATFQPVQFGLTVNRAGTGNGMVVSAPDGIACGDSCTAQFASGTLVVLTPEPAAGSTFIGWGGACSGAGACVVTMNGPKTVTALFSKILHPLAVTLGGDGKGSVTSGDQVINCGGNCQASFPSGTVVTLTATPKLGSVFDGWGGACHGTGACTVSMDAPREVTAAFRRIEWPPLPRLDGGGRVILRLPLAFADAVIEEAGSFDDSRTQWKSLEAPRVQVGDYLEVTIMPTRGNAYYRFSLPAARGH